MVFNKIYWPLLVKTLFVCFILVSRCKLGTFYSSCATLWVTFCNNWPDSIDW
jgi:hypothetical protein